MQILKTNIKKRGDKMWERTKGFGIIIGITIAVCLGVKYLLPLTLPFLIAFFIVLLIHPLVEKTHRKIKLNRGIITGTLMLLLVLILSIGLWFLLQKIANQVGNIFGNIDAFNASLREILDGCCSSFENIFGINAASVRDFIVKNVDKILLNLEENTIPKLMENSLGYAIFFMEAFGVGLIIFISIILLTKDFNDIKENQKQFFYYQGLRTFGIEVVKASKNYFKAQLIIMAVIAGICIAALFLTGNSYALVTGIIIGLLDTLPVIGTGFVFVPWAAFYLIQGNFLYAAIYITIYIVCSMAREFLEPKLIGEKLGIPSIMVLVSVYIGLKLFGFGGIITGPMAYLLIKEFSNHILKSAGISLKS